MVNYLLIDLDDTLYPASSPLGRLISDNINAFAARHLGVSLDEARKLRRETVPVYGSTMSWLIAKHGLIDLDAYMDFVHPKNVGQYIPRDDRLAELLSSIELPKSILTNSPARHAYRVLSYLGIERLFDRVFDLSYFGFRGKPNQAVYDTALREIGRRASEVLYIDDQSSYLLPFQRMGGRVALVDESGEAETNLPRVRSLHELPRLMAEINGDGVGLRAGAV